MIKYIFIFFIISISFTSAQEKYFELVRADFNAEKVKYITEAMNLTDEQSSVFWPSYREYDLKKSKIGDEWLQLIKSYAEVFTNINDEQADNIIKKLFALKEKEQNLNKEYYNKFKNTLSAVIAARFIQVENEIDNFVKVQVNAQLPLIGIKTNVDKN